jgi:hypothetical protein
MDEDLEDDIYGDGLGVDPDTVPAKYMTLMVSPPCVCAPNGTSNKSRTANVTRSSLNLTMSTLYLPPSSAAG